MIQKTSLLRRTTLMAAACLAPREAVEIDGVSYLVRDVRAVGDGSKRRATLTRL